MSYTVAQRSREIGIRLALGAQASMIVRLIVGDGLKLAVGGVVVGLVAACASARLIAPMLFGVTPTDPLTFAVVAAPLVIALLASLLPAWRASRIDALPTLRGGAE